MENTKNEIEKILETLPLEKVTYLNEDGTEREI